MEEIRYVALGRKVVPLERLLRVLFTLDLGPMKVVR